MSDDPLSDCIFMILDDSSSPKDGGGCRHVCAYSVHTGFMYIGTPGETVS